MQCIEPRQGEKHTAYYELDSRILNWECHLRGSFTTLKDTENFVALHKANIFWQYFTEDMGTEKSAQMGLTNIGLHSFFIGRNENSRKVVLKGFKGTEF